MFNWNIKENPIRSIFGMGGGVGSPAIVRGPVVALYSFSSFTFTPGGKNGRQSQPLTDFLNDSSYDTSSNPWLSNTNYFSMPQDGFQLWTVAEDAVYTIEARGASGGSVSAPGQPSTNYYAEGGGGATITANFSLSSGDKLLIITGQYGTPFYGNASGGGAGGGGGTFVLKENASGDDDIYIIAGGGGGGSYWPSRIPTTFMNGANSPGDTTDGGDAQNPFTAPSSYGNPAPGPGGGGRTLGGTNGYGGGAGLGGGGGGFYGSGGAGPDGAGVHPGGEPYRNGHGYTSSPVTPSGYLLRGGYVTEAPSPSGWYLNRDQGSGGFGGGAAAQVITGYGGGAGGYSGGGGGTFGPPARQQSGGYGGSYVNPLGTNVTRTAGTNIPSTSQGTHGQVIITKN